MNVDLASAPDAAGLPGPPWLFHVLLVFTFFLHLLFLNAALGGSLLGWASHLRARGGGTGSPHARLAARITRINGFAISLAITTGVAPLLFIQTLYQPWFYSGTILLGWIWFSLVVLLMVGYYATYLYKDRGAPRTGRGGGAWLGLAALAFVFVATIHVAAQLTHTQETGWSGFAANPWTVLGDPTYVPRLIHFVLASVAFSALVLSYVSERRVSAGRDEKIESAIARTCRRWALWATALQVVDGVVLLFVLPRTVLDGLVARGPATLGPLTLAIALSVGLLIVLAGARDAASARGATGVALAIMVAAIAVMAVTRDQVRGLYLGPGAEATEWTVVPQWGNFALFAGLLGIALVVVAYVARLALGEPASGDGAA